MARNIAKANFQLIGHSALKISLNQMEAIKMLEA